MLESILQLRDDKAKSRNLPPFKILGNAQIMAIAEMKPATVEDLGRIEGLSPKQVKKLGASILQKTMQSMALPEDKRPAFPKNEHRIGAKVTEKVKALKMWRDKRAKEIGIDSSLVFTNAQIKSLALAYPKTRKDLEDICNIRTWQKKAFGNEICALLKGIA